MFELFTAIGGIILVDLALSGDNALVIGAAAAGLPARQQRRAIIIGGAGAIALRVALGAAATLLLRLPLLQAAGGALLLLVALRLIAGQLRSAHGSAHGETVASHGTTRPADQGFIAALVTILVADVTMSLDNVLAVGALAAGNLPVLAGGLLLSMVILLVGSTLVARLIERATWLVDVAALVLGYTAGQMVAHDAWLHPFLQWLPAPSVVLPVAGVAFVLVGDMLLRWRRRHSASRKLSAQRVPLPATALETPAEQETARSTPSSPLRG